MILFLWFFTEETTIFQFDSDKVFLDNSKSTHIENNYGEKPYDLGIKFLKQSEIDESKISKENSLRMDALSDKDYGLFLSDFQGVDTSQLFSLKKDTSSSKSLFHMGDISLNQNLFIDSAYVYFDTEDLSKLQVVLIPKLSGKETHGSCIFRLLHNKRQVSTVALNFSDLDKVVFDIPIDMEGMFIVELEGDDVYYDNEFFFYLNKRMKPAVSIISGESDNLYLKEVFGNSNIFDLYMLDSRSIDYEVIEQSDIVVINAIDHLPSGFISQLNNKTVIIFPSDNANQMIGWKGISLLELNEQKMPWFLEIDYDHPLFAGVFEKQNEQSEMPFGTPIFSVNGDYEVVISYRNKDPFLIKLTNSDVYIFNSSIQSDLSNITSHAIFLPLMYQLAFSSQEYSQQVFFYPNDILNVDVENQEYPPKIIADGLELIPEFNPSQEGLALKIPELTPGFYKIVIPGDSMVIAVNSPNDESIMKGVSYEELSLFFKDSEHIEVLSNAQGYGSEIAEPSLWKYALILILLFVMTETMLHRFLK